MLDLKATMLCLTCCFGCLNGTYGLACFDGLNLYRCCNRMGGLDWFCGLGCISGLPKLGWFNGLDGFVVFQGNM